MRIVLTPEQQQALDAAQGIARVIDPRTSVSYVLVRSDTYERIQRMLSEDFTSEDAFQAQIESAAAAGWDDPALDVYNDLDPRRQP